MVAVVLELEVDRGRNAGVLQHLLGLGGVGLALTVAIGGLQRVVMAGQSVGDEGVHRGVGALVDLLAQLIAVDEVGDGLAHGLGLVGVGVGLGLAVGLDLEVEGQEAFLTARPLDDLDLGVLGQVLDVGRGQRAEGHVDLALLDVELEVGRVGEVLDLDGVVLGRGQALVAVVLLVGRGLVHLERGELVRAGERVPLDDGVGVGQLVGVEDLFVDNGSGRAGHDLLERHIERHGVLEHDGGIVRRLDGFDVGEQRARAVRVVDRLDAVIRELDIGCGQVMTVRELQPFLDLYGEFGAVIIPCTVIGGDIRAQFGRIVILCIQERENLNLHGIRTIVVRARGIHAGDLIGGADGDRGSARRIGVLHAAACGQRCDCRDGCDSRQKLAMILQGKYLFLNYSPRRLHWRGHQDYGVIVLAMCFHTNRL